MGAMYTTYKVLENTFVDIAILNQSIKSSII